MNPVEVDAGRQPSSDTVHVTFIQQTTKPCAMRSYQKRGWFMGVPYIVIQYVMIYMHCVFTPHKQSSKHDRPGVTAQIKKKLPPITITVLFP